MGKYSNDYSRKRAISAGLTLLLLGIIYSTSRNAELSTDLEEELGKAYSLDTGLDHNQFNLNNEMLPNDSQMGIIDTNQSTIDYSNYRDVVYEPFTHKVYIKVEGSLAFDSMNVNAPDGYQADYSIQMEDSNSGNRYVYGCASIEYTNTERVLVREYYDTETKTYVYVNFGTVMEKEKTKKLHDKKN